MIAIEFSYPAADVEERIVTSEAGIAPEQAAKLVRLGQAIRRIETGGLREVASTRVLISAGRMAAAGLSLAAAAKVAIAGPLTDDAQVRSEEHTSELQSLMRISYAVFCLNKKINYH